MQVSAPKSTSMRWLVLLLLGALLLSSSFVEARVALGGDEESSDESEESSSDSEDSSGSVVHAKEHKGKGHTIVIANQNKINQNIKSDNGNVAQMMAMMQQQHAEQDSKRSSEAARKRGREQEKKQREQKEKEEKEKAQEQKEKAEAKKRQEAAAKKVAEAKRKAHAREQRQKQERRRKQEQQVKRKNKAREQQIKRRNKAREHQAKHRNRARERLQKRRHEQQVKRSHARLHPHWRNYGGGYDGLRAVRYAQLCYVSGLVRHVGGTSFIGWLPRNCHPNRGRLIFGIIRNGVNARVDVLRDGRMFAITGRHHGWLSLSGITFNVGQNGGVTLVHGWRNYGSSYRAHGYTRWSDLCYLSGLIRSGRWGYFGRMPRACWPARGRLIFSADNHQQVTRVDMLGNGYFLRSGGYHNHGWVSLDGIIYSRSGGRNLALNSRVGWRNYGGGYRGAMWRKVGRVCVLSGLIRGSFRNPIARLPRGCRPAARLIFAANVHMRSARIDVLPSGLVYYINGRMRWNWLSLSNIHFIAYR